MSEYVAGHVFGVSFVVRVTPDLLIGIGLGLTLALAAAIWIVLKRPLG